MKELVHIMATCFEQVAFFFSGGNPQEQESFIRRAAYLEQREFERERLADRLLKYHQRIGAGPNTIKNIERLSKDGTFAIVTGQQAGFLTGPLYTLYKALTAIKLAAVQEEKLGRPVVPIFWIASEDHDWAEIHQTYLLDEEGKPVACRLPGEGMGRSVGSLGVPQWQELTHLVEALPEGVFKEDITKHLKRFTMESENLAEWFARILQWLVQDRGLIFFDPMLPEFKALASPMYERIFKSHEEVREAFQTRTQRLTQEGFKAQIEQTGGEVNLFFATPERRAILWQKDKGFYLRGENNGLSLDQFCASLKHSPQAFSPNVVTRPVVQDYLLPTLAYVPGPGELNYWAQLGGVFNVLGQRMPILFPRLSAVILTAAWYKTMVRENLTVQQVYEGLSEYRDQLVRKQDGLDIDRYFMKLRKQVAQAYEELKPLAVLHTHAEEWIGWNLDKVNGQIAYLEAKLRQAQRKRCKGSLQKLEELENGIYPLRVKQERLLNPFSFVVHYGLGFVDQVAQLPLTGDFKEHELVIVHA